MKGTFELSNFREPGTVESLGKDPNKTLITIDFPGLGTLKKGFDGETRWVQTPSGIVTDSSPQEIAEMERDSDVYSAGKIKSLFESMTANLAGADLTTIAHTVKAVQSKVMNTLNLDVEEGTGIYDNASPVLDQLCQPVFVVTFDPPPCFSERLVRNMLFEFRQLLRMPDPFIADRV